VVSYLQGRTDSMIFILNRVDSRGSDDLPVEVRLERLRIEIKNVLELADLPDVIPFNARLLYNAQCAWGTTALNTASEVAPEVRSERLKAFFHDCAAIIRDKTSGDRSLRDWFRQIDDNLQEGHLPDDYEMRRIMFYALEWSGGKALWTLIRTRIQESFSELVILPVLLNVFNSFDALTGSLDILIETRKILNQEQVEAERDKITTIRQNLQKNTKKINSDFQKEVREYVEGLKTGDPKKVNKVKKDAEKKGRKGFAVIFETVADVEGDLTTSLTNPVRDALQNHQNNYDLEEKLKEVIAPPLAKDIAKIFSEVKPRINKFSDQSEFLYRRVLADNKAGKIELEHDEQYFRLFYHTIRQAMTARAEFFLQARVKLFELALQSLVDEQLRRLQVCLSERELSSIDLEQAAIGDLRKKLSENLPTLPEKFFEFSNTIKQSTKKISEVIGIETYIEEISKTRYENRKEYYTEGSCFKSTKSRTKSVPVTYTDQEERSRDKYGDVEYVELYLPSISSMAKQWAEGIAQKKEDLWDILCEWILHRLDSVNDLFEESVIDITDLAERALNEQLKFIESDFEQQRQSWHGFEVEKRKVDENRKNLENEYR